MYTYSHSGDSGNEPKCITDLLGTFQLELFWQLCVYIMSANDTIHCLYLLHNSPCCSTNSFGAEAFRRPSKHENLEYKFARLKVSVRFQLRKCLSKYRYPNEFFWFKQGALFIRIQTCDNGMLQLFTEVG